MTILTATDAITAHLHDAGASGALPRIVSQVMKGTIYLTNKSADFDLVLEGIDYVGIPARRRAEIFAWLGTDHIVRHLLGGAVAKIPNKDFDPFLLLALRGHFLDVLAESEADGEDPIGYYEMHRHQFAHATGVLAERLLSGTPLPEDVGALEGVKPLSERPNVLEALARFFLNGGNLGRYLERDKQGREYHLRTCGDLIEFIEDSLRLRGRDDLVGEAEYLLSILGVDDGNWPDAVDPVQDEARLRAAERDWSAIAAKVVGDGLMTADEAAEEANVSRMTIIRWAREDVTLGRKVDGAWRVNPNRLNDYIFGLVEDTDDEE